MKTKMKQEQWLQLKMLLLFGDNMKIVFWWEELTFFGGGGIFLDEEG